MPIYEKKSGWGIENVKGTSNTYQEAVKRVQAIKANQAQTQAKKEKEKEKKTGWE